MVSVLRFTIESVWKWLDDSYLLAETCHCGFESLQEHGCLSLVRVVCCQLEVSAF
jgi:hypothetical protein